VNAPAVVGVQVITYVFYIVTLPFEYFNIAYMNTIFKKISEKIKDVYNKCLCKTPKTMWGKIVESYNIECHNYSHKNFIWKKS
jgi:hypothetical protein